MDREDVNSLSDSSNENMDTTDLTSQSAAEDLSDRSDSNHSESNLQVFDSFKRMDSLNLISVNCKDEQRVRSKDIHTALNNSLHPNRFGEYAGHVTNELPLTLDKKDLDFHRGEKVDGTFFDANPSDPTAVVFRNKDLNQKDARYNFAREMRQKASLHVAMERNCKDINLAHLDRDIKDYGLLKAYGLPLDRLNLSLDRVREARIGNSALDRLRNNSLTDSPSIIEASDFKNLQMQSRNPQVDSLTFPHIRHSQLFSNEHPVQGANNQFPHAHHSITQITHMQHSHQQQQQTKSFTIDAILGLRSTQRERHQRGQHHTYRKHQGQEGSTKGSTGSCSNGGSKLKRVRTIFTAEQLERLEGEFARQQYMVGPERLYLAHALRLTEAQVKVWFQNRRIKWRKLNHEQQSQRLHEIHQTSIPSLEREDSNGHGEW